VPRWWSTPGRAGAGSSTRPCWPSCRQPDSTSSVNGSFHAGRPITGDAGADDRLLLVYRLGGPTRRALISATVRHAVLGARRTLKEPAFLAVSELWLDTDPPLPLDVDGEIRAHTPARIALAPQALRVMVAPGFHDL
jgi:diacylglycerol kinase (ATP)